MSRNPGPAQTPDSRRHLTPRLQRLAGRCDAGPVINSNKFIHLYLSLSFRDCAGNVTKLSTCTHCASPVAAAVTDTFYVRQFSQHRQSSCSVHCTAALPVLAELVDVERITSHSTNAIGALCTSAFKHLECSIKIYCYIFEMSCLHVKIV